MIKVDVRLDLAGLQKQLSYIQQKNLPYATALALTNTARDGEQAIKREMKRVFDRPTPFTLNSTYVKPATKQNLIAEVGIKDSRFAANAPIKYLDHNIYGGGRLNKRFEDLLIRAGVMPAGTQAVPGAGMKLDRYGNMPSGAIQQILAGTQSAFDPLQRATPRSKRRNRAVAAIFGIPKQRGNLAPGVYKRVGRSVVPLLLFVRPAKYMARLAVDRIVQTTTRDRFARQFEVAMSYAIATSR